MYEFFLDEVFREKLDTAPWGNIHAVPQDRRRQGIGDQVTILENVLEILLIKLPPSNLSA